VGKVIHNPRFDDFHEDGSQEFANMKATSNYDAEIAMGRDPKDMCRPATDSRAGFMESQGAGVCILMSASLALQMGVPIRGIIACVNTATDKNGRSIPAPGQGVLTTAREVKSKFVSPLLDFEYRRRQINQEREYVKDWVAREYKLLSSDLEASKEVNSELINERSRQIEQQGMRKVISRLC
jgi:fatty acid synthase subunit alpha, fungi type